MRNLKFWDKWSEACKRTVLRNLGVRDPRDEVLPWTPCLNLAMWGEYLPLGLRLNDFCQVHSPYEFIGVSDPRSILTMNL